MGRPLVSVIVPVYNGEFFLAGAVENIRRQDYNPVEIIIVDDGSTDNTAKIAGHFENEVICVHQENRGPAAARNKGLQKARGDVISFLDVDDLWSENKLSLQLTLFTEVPSLEIVLGLSQPMKLRKEEDGRSEFEKWYDPYCALLLGAAVFRRSVFDKVGFFDETLHYGEDTDWFMRAREQGVSMTITEAVTLFYRRHEFNMTLDTAARNRYFVKVLKKSLDRRRQKGGGSVAPFPKLAAIEKS